MGLEPKRVMRLTCGNTTETDISILLDPAASASIPGNGNAVRYVPHRNKAAVARASEANPPGRICRLSLHGKAHLSSARGTPIQLITA
ncbi:hypothetical protein [Streptomyces finlayi]|uniref:hypothetical protein n=1 Tax=Streptomyces finlayi TaxID=67296 RepID=UPI00162755A2|nr:hypothetical protein [Streptomyces finlayi]